MPTSDGAGVRLQRALGQPGLGEHDPFLLLDEFRATPEDGTPPGFPDHPHRGFETVTYMLQGTMVHRDSMGNTGHLGPGDVQWMTAGSGIIHSEMPEPNQHGIHGFQLWVNLPRDRKMSAPRYQDISASSIPAVETEFARVNVIAGTYEGRTGPVDADATTPVVLDVDLRGQDAIHIDVPAALNAFAYVFEDGCTFGATDRVPQGHLVLLGPGDQVAIGGGGRALLLAGRPLGEPVARYGPFVMNTRDELVQAIDDYRNGRLVAPNG